LNLGRLTATLTSVCGFYLSPQETEFQTQSLNILQNQSFVHMIACTFMKESVITKVVFGNAAKRNSNGIICSLLRFSCPVYNI
jgi:hypothetical protein